jgi:hypothetical protein
LKRTVLPEDEIKRIEDFLNEDPNGSYPNFRDVCPDSKVSGSTFGRYKQKRLLVSIEAAILQFGSRVTFKEYESSKHRLGMSDVTFYKYRKLFNNDPAFLKDKENKSLHDCRRSRQIKATTSPLYLYQFITKISGKSGSAAEVVETLLCALNRALDLSLESVQLHNDDIEIRRVKK